MKVDLQYVFDDGGLTTFPACVAHEAGTLVMTLSLFSCASKWGAAWEFGRRRYQNF